MNNKFVESLLLNRTIVEVRYMTDEEANNLEFFHRGVALKLDDGTILYACKDNEGNDAGALHYFKDGDENTVLPVIKTIIE
jgi:hypothetical protein